LKDRQLGLAQIFELIDTKSGGQSAKADSTEGGSGENNSQRNKFDKFDKEVVGDDPCCSPDRDLSMTLANWARLATGGKRNVASIAINWRRPRERRQ